MHQPTLAIALVLALCGCNSNSKTGAPAPNAFPAVRAAQLPASGSGALALQFDLVDPDGTPADVTVEISYDGQTFRPATITGLTTGLPTSAAGVTTSLSWDSLADMGFRATPGATLRITASNGDGSGAATAAAIPGLDNMRLALAAADTQMIHYGAIDAAVAAQAKQHDLVVVHPFAGSVSAATIRDIQLGVDPDDPSDDVVVFAYISVGEDSRTVGLTDAQMLLDARFVGDATGPRIDPRGPAADGQSMVGISLLGSPTNAPAGTRYASFYLDDNSVDRDAGDIGDGLPDRNAAFGGCFVNAGDPAWFEVLDQMTMDGADGLPGIAELLSSDFGRGYACDGLFLDTFDTCAPNSYTDSSSFNQSEFEWTAPGFTSFLATLRQRYPDKLVLQNRGMFLFDPRLPHYAVTPREHVDAVLVESYRLDSSSSQQFDAYFSADNKHNFAPKLLAESQRSDGFKILSLGYAEGPGIDLQTLRNLSTTGLATLLTDIDEAQHQAGFVHYLTDAGLTLANTFTLENLAADSAAPVWSSTYNGNIPAFPTPPNAPDQRVGIQQVMAGNGTLTVRWDVARDQSRVGYALYTSLAPFDFSGDPMLQTASRTVLVPGVGDGYTAGVGPTTYAFEDTITGLTNGTTYYACVRAFDTLGNEEQNQVTLTGTPQAPAQIVIDGAFAEWAQVPIAHTDPDDVADSAGPDWLEIKVTNDADNLFVRYTSANAFNLDGSPTYVFSRTLIFLDLDQNPSTGWPVGSIGSDLAIAGDQLFTQSSTTFNTGSLGGISALPTTNVTECELAVPWTAIDGIVSGAAAVHILFVNDEVSDYAPDAGRVTYTATR